MPLVSTWMAWMILRIEDTLLRTHHMYRRILWLLCLALWGLTSSLALAAGRPAGLPEQINNGEPVTIVVNRLKPMTDAFDNAAKAEVAVAKAFTALYPNVTLKPFTFLTVPGAGGGTFFDDTNTLMSMAAGIAPDVLTTNFRQSDTYIRQGFLKPLDEEISEWRASPAGEKEFQQVFSAAPALKEVCERYGPDKQKHWYAVPPQTLVLVLYRLKDKLNAAGINAEKPPTDWNEFFKQCLQVTDPRPEKDMYAYNLSSTWFLSYMLWSAGSEILGPKADNPMDWEAKYHDWKAVRAFQYAWLMRNVPWAICPDTSCNEHFILTAKPLDLGNPTVQPAGTTDLSEKIYDLSNLKKTPASSAKFTCTKCGKTWSMKALNDKKAFFNGFCTDDMNKYWQGKVAFQISYMGDISLIMGALDPAVTGISRVPADPVTGNAFAEVNSTMYAINATQKDPAKVEAAWAYIRFRCSDEAKKIMTRVYVEGGYAKYLNPTWLRRWFPDYLSETQADWEKTFTEAMKYGRPEPYGKNAQQIYNEMDKAWGEIYTNLDSADGVKIKEILNVNVARTNERLFAQLPAEVKKKRDTTALAVVLISVILFAFLFRFTMAAYGQALKSENLRTKAATRQILAAWVIMLPALAAVTLFQYVPLARGSVIAFQDYQILLGGKFVGLSNFGEALFSEAFWSSLKNTLTFAAIALGFGFIAPVILALLLHEIPRGSLFFRIVYYLPSVTVGVVIMLLWMQLYDPQATGMLNQVLGAFNVEPQKFLQDPKLVMFWVVLPTVWAGMGPGCIIYLAALVQIPTEYYEAADVDGAGMFTKLKNITLPFLRPLLIINFVGACVGAMRSFESILIMTGGGPAESSQVLGLTIFQNSFMYLRYGFATAMGWIMATMLIGFTMFQLRYLSKIQYRLAKSD